MDAWKLAEVKGALYTLLLKVDTMAAGNEKMQLVQEELQEALEILEEIRG